MGKYDFRKPIILLNDIKEANRLWHWRFNQILSSELSRAQKLHMVKLWESGGRQGQTFKEKSTLMAGLHAKPAYFYQNHKDLSNMGWILEFEEQGRTIITVFPIILVCQFLNGAKLSDTRQEAASLYHKKFIEPVESFCRNAPPELLSRLVKFETMPEEKYQDLILPFFHYTGIEFHYGGKLIPLWWNLVNLFLSSITHKIEKLLLPDPMLVLFLIPFCITYLQPKIVAYQISQIPFTPAELFESEKALDELRRQGLLEPSESCKDSVKGENTEQECRIKRSKGDATKGNGESAKDVSRNLDENTNHTVPNAVFPSSASTQAANHDNYYVQSDIDEVLAEHCIGRRPGDERFVKTLLTRTNEAIAKGENAEDWLHQHINLLQDDSGSCNLSEMMEGVNNG